MKRILLLVVVVGLGWSELWGQSQYFHQLIGPAYGGKAIVNGNEFVIAGRANGSLMLMKTDDQGKPSLIRTISTRGYFGDFIQDFDGNLVVCGQIAQPYWDFGVIAFNQNGNILWKVSFDGGNTDLTYGITQLKDSSYLVVGLIKQDPFVANPMNMPALIKINRDGTPAKAKVVKVKADMNAQRIAATRDGGFILSTQLADAHGNFLLMKMDKNANTQWMKSYGHPHNTFAWRFSELVDGDIILNGSIWDSTGNPNFDAMLLRLDSSGNVRWAKKYHTPYSDYIRSVTQTPDSGFLAVGGTHVSGRGYISAIKTDLSGNIEWAKGYGYDSTFTEIYEQGDAGMIYAGGYVIIGNQQDTMHEFKYLEIIRTDSTGASGCNYWDISLIQDSFSLSGYDTTYVDSVITGFIHWDVQEDAFSLVFDTSCTGLFSNLGSNDISNDELNIYPNPAKNSITILTSEPMATIKISNLLGQVLFSEKISGGKKEIDVSHLPTGMYFVNNRKLVKE